MSNFEDNACRFHAASGGVADYMVASAVAGFKTPTQANAVDGHSYRYYAETPGPAQYEYGKGLWDEPTQTLQRTIITMNSESTFVAINFSSPPEVDIFPLAPQFLEDPVTPAIVPTSTNMLFQQTAAPVGWTKVTTHNDKALRVVSGAAASGGISAFSSVMSYRTSDGHALLFSEVPSAPAGNSANQPPYCWTNTGYDPSPTNAQPHSHTLDMRVAYVDVIIAYKN